MEQSHIGISDVRLFIVGDTHGNLSFWTEYLFKQVRLARPDAIVQVGDFGFWEHATDGVEYLDNLNEAAADLDQVIYALHGNHDNWKLVMAKYGHDRDEEGFVVVRSHIRYIPQGHIWTWDGLRMRAFGGAYSVDKDWRVQTQEKRYRAAASREEHRRKAGEEPRPVPSFKNTLWFEDEQMTQEEFAQLLIDDAQPVDVVFSHDKPRRSDPGIELKNIAACWPNQDNLQLALECLTPRWWFHGHLHHLYTDSVSCAQDGERTAVIGLSCDSGAAMRSWRPSDSWCVFQTHSDRPPSVLLPPDMREPEHLEVNR